MTAAELLSLAAFAEGRHAQAFPTFGSERMGAPVTAFCRIDSRAIRVHDPIAEPDAIIVQDPTLLHQVDVFGGLQPDGYVLLNTAQSFEQLGLGDLVERVRPERALTVPATELAREHLGRPMPNVPMLGAFAALTGVVSLHSVATAIGERFEGRVREGNVAAARAAHDLARSALEEPAHA